MELLITFLVWISNRFESQLKSKTYMEQLARGLFDKLLYMS